MDKPIDLKEFRNITVSGRIASGSSTLAKHLADALGWNMFNGGELFRKFTRENGLSLVNTESRPDDIDLAYEERIKKMLTEESHNIIESHLSGFDAQGIKGVFKILVICEDDIAGVDKTDIRIDRLVNRDEATVEHAKHEVMERERQNLSKWRRLYAKDEPDWVYWDKKYYDFVVNTYSHNADEGMQIVLEKLGIHTHVTP